MSGKFDVLKLEGLNAALAFVEHGHSKEVALYDGFMDALLGIINPPQDSNINNETKLLALRILNHLVDHVELIEHLNSKGATTALQSITFLPPDSPAITTTLKKLQTPHSTDKSNNSSI